MIHDIPDPIPLHDNIPYAQTRDLSVEVPVDEYVKTDAYVDDFITIDVEKDDTLDRITKEPITVLQADAGDVINSENIPRDNLSSIDKMKAEGAAEERKKIALDGYWIQEGYYLVYHTIKHHDGKLKLTISLVTSQQEKND